MYLTEQLDKSYELKKSVRSALIYPVMIICLMILLSLGLSTFLMPKLVGLFTKLEVPLPLITRIFLVIISFLAKNALYLLIGLVAIIFPLRLLTKLKRIQSVFHTIYLHLPIVGRLIRNTILARFSRTSQILLKSGLTLTKTLEVTAKTIDNQVYQKKIEKIIPSLRGGESFFTSLENFPKEFPLTLTKTVRVGEKTGRLEESLKYLADFYEAEVGRAVKNLTAVLEPALLIIIGLAVGLLAVSIILPIYQFVGQIGQ